jgi:HSP20 family protein
MSTSKNTVSVSREGGSGQPERAPAPVQRFREPAASLRREIDRLFDDMTAAWPQFRMPRGGLFDVAPWAGLGAAPAADIVEKDGEFVMTLEAPGMDEKDIEVKVSDGAISIRGEMTQEKQEEKENYRLSERRHGSFARSFTLPASVDADRISAKYDKGVLTVAMPKSDDARKRQRKIEVKAA